MPPPPAPPAAAWKAHLPLIAMAAVASAVIFYLWRELQKARTALMPAPSPERLQAGGGGRGTKHAPPEDDDDELFDFESADDEPFANQPARQHHQHPQHHQPQHRQHQHQHHQHQPHHHQHYQHAYEPELHDDDGENGEEHAVSHAVSQAADVAQLKIDGPPVSDGTDASSAAEPRAELKDAPATGKAIRRRSTTSRV